MKPYGYDAAEMNDFGDKLDSTKMGRTPTKTKREMRRIDKKKRRAKTRQESVRDGWDSQSSFEYVMDSIDLEDWD